MTSFIRSLVIAILVLTYAHAAKPNKPQWLWSTPSHATGTLSVKYNLWSGYKSTKFNLRANSIVVAQDVPTGESGAGAQLVSAQIDLSAIIVSGTYSFIIEACNQDGCTASSPRTITITAGGSSLGGNVVVSAVKPDEPHISYARMVDNSLNVKWAMWWGKSGDNVKLYLGETLVTTDALSDYTSSNSGQGTVISISPSKLQEKGITTGTYPIRVDLCKEDTCTKSIIVTRAVTVSAVTTNTNTDTNANTNTDTSNTAKAPKAPDVHDIASNIDSDFVLSIHREEGYDLHKNDIIKLEHKIPSANLTTTYTLGKADTFKKNFNVKINFIASSTFASSNDEQVIEKTIAGSDITIDSDDTNPLVHKFSFIMCNDVGCTKVATPLTTTIKQKTTTPTPTPSVTTPTAPEKPEISISNPAQGGNGIDPLTFTLKLNKPIGVKGSTWKIKHLVKGTNDLEIYTLGGVDSRSFQSRNDPAQTKDVIVNVSFSRATPTVYDTIHEHIASSSGNTINIVAYNKAPNFKTHIFTPVLCNNIGCSDASSAQEITISYTGNFSEYAPKAPVFTEAPQAPVMSTLQANYTGDFSITINKWAGTSGTNWKLEHRIVEADKTTTYDLGTATIPSSNVKGLQTKKLGIKVHFTDNESAFEKQDSTIEVNVDASNNDDITISTFSEETLTHVFTPMLCNSVGCTRAVASKTTHLSDPSQAGKIPRDKSDRALEKFKSISKVLENPRSKNLNLDKSTWDQKSAKKTGLPLKAWKAKISTANSTYIAPKPRTCSNIVNGKINGKESMAYFASWAMWGRKHYPRDVDGCKYTGVLFAFGYPAPNGRLYLGDGAVNIVKHIGEDSSISNSSKYSDDPKLGFYGGFSQLIQFKKEYPHIKTYLSIGGWTWSTYLAAIANNPNVKKVFIADTIEMIRTFQFDGVDLDWEFPSNATDRANLTSLLTDLRAALNEAVSNPKPGFEFSSDETQKKFIYTPANNKFTLSIAVAPNPVEDIQYMDLAKINPLLDFVVLMGYDYAGSWDTKTGHLTPLYNSGNEGDSPHKYFNVASSINAYINGEVSTTNPGGFNNTGFDSEKIILGLGYYGRGWETDGKDVYHKVGAGKAPVGSWENGAIDYNALVEAYRADKSNWTLIWDKKAKAPMAHGLYTPRGKAANSYDTKGKTPKRAMWSYDDPRSICEKVNYLKSKNLGGAFGWESSSDNGDLIDSTVASLKGNVDCDSAYPDTNYDVIYDGGSNAGNDDTVTQGTLTPAELAAAKKLLDEQLAKKKAEEDKKKAEEDKKNNVDNSAKNNNAKSTIKTLGAWVKGTVYQAGNIVGTGPVYYKCNGWPYTAWCSSREPGFGNGWGQAWSEVKGVVAPTVINSAPAIANISDKVFAPGALITPIAFNNTGGEIQSCEISPALVSGLSLNSTTCAISGTPSSELTKTLYTIKATNTAGDNTATVNITISNKFAISGDPTLSIKINTLYSFTPTVNKTGVSFTIENKPDWLTFNTTSGKLEGTPTAAGNAVDIIISATYNGEKISLATFTIKVSSDEVVVRNEGEVVNIARYSIATQPKRGTWYEEPSLAIDGDYTTANHTDNGYEAKWIQLALPTNSTIDSVKLYHGSGNLGRLAGAKLYLLDSPYNGKKSSLVNEDVLNTFQAIKVQEWRNTTNVSKKYLLISDSNDFLHLQEIEVYGVLPDSPYVVKGKYKFTVDQRSHNIANKIGQVPFKHYYNKAVTYSIEGSTAFRIDSDGNIYVKSALEAKNYTFKVKGTHGAVSATQEVELMSLGKGNSFKSRHNKQVIAINPKAVNTLNIRVASSTTAPLSRGQRARGTSTWLAQENGQNILFNDSFRTIKSLIGYTGSGSNKQFMKLEFSQNIEPYSRNILGSINSNISIFHTALQSNAKFSFNSMRSVPECTTGSMPNANKIIYCAPTTRLETPYSDKSVFKQYGYSDYSEQQIFTKVLGTWNHFYNTINGMESIKAYINETDYKGMPFSKKWKYSSSNYLTSETRPNSFSKFFFTAFSPNYEARYRVMRYKFMWVAGIAENPAAAVIGEAKANASVSIWEEEMRFKKYGSSVWENDNSSNTNGAHNYEIYKTIEHETLHARGSTHKEGMTYGWADAASTYAIPKFYPIDGAGAIFKAPKYFFDTTRTSRNTLDIQVYKTSDATKNNLTFDVYSAELRIDDDFTFDNISGNKLKFTMNSAMFPRLFLRVYGEDSDEFASKFIDQKMMIGADAYGGNDGSYDYYLFSHDDWSRTTKLLNAHPEPAIQFNFSGRDLSPAAADIACRALVGEFYAEPAKIGSTKAFYKTLNSVVKSSSWTGSKKFVVQTMDVSSEYAVYDYTQSSIKKTNIADEYDLITDTSVGLMCRIPGDVISFKGTGTTLNYASLDSLYSFTPYLRHLDIPSYRAKRRPIESLATFSIQNKPDWLSFDTKTGKLEGTPRSLALGSEFKNIIISAHHQDTTVSLVPFTIKIAPENIAKKGIATSSDSNPQHLIDGDYDTTVIAGNSNSSWMQIALPAGSKIDGVSIYTTNITYDTNIMLAELYILDAPYNGRPSSLVGKKLHTYENRGLVQDWINTNNVSGKFVLVKSGRWNGIELRELEVYGTTP